MLTENSAIEDVVARTLEHALVINRSKAYKYYARRIVERFSGRRAASITRGDVQRWAVERLRVNKPSSVNSEIAFLSRCFRTLQDHGVDVANPALGIKLPPVQNCRDRVLSIEDETRLRDTMLLMPDGATHWSIIDVVLHTGMRRLEMLSLRVGDYGAECLSLRRTKTSKPRIIPLNDAADAHCAEWAKERGASEWLFLPAWGNDRYEAGEQWCADVFKPAVRVAGIEDFTFRDLRRTFASRVINAGATLYVVQQLLGHASPVMTQRYTVLALESLRDAVEKLSKL